MRSKDTTYIFWGYNIRNEFLRWDEYPIVGSSNSEHYLSPEATRDYNKHNNMKFEQLKKGLPNPNKYNNEKKYIAKAIDIGKAFNFNKTKVRASVSCDNCAVPR